MSCDAYAYKLNTIEYPKAPYNPPNEVYSAVSEILYNLGFDKDNPFKNMVAPGNKVVLKPNLVYHEHPIGNSGMDSMITHASVLRPIIDYILLATNNNVDICIGDAPVQAGDFEKALELSGIKDLISYYQGRGINVKAVDFRQIITKKNSRGIKIEKKNNPNRTKESYITVNLGDRSALNEVINKAVRFEITDYGFGAVKKHHMPGKNEYIIAREVIEADLFVCLPKLKTHRKAGLTCAMKNLVGINGDKTCLAHHTRGNPDNGGDEFNKNSIRLLLKVRLWSFLKTNKVGISIAGSIKIFAERFVWKKPMKEYHMENVPTLFHEGNWHGNDTIWRCVNDLNRIILFSDKTGMMQESIQRNYLCITDAVIAGDGEGPMEQTAKNLGILFGSLNPLFNDYLAAKLMSFDWKLIPSIRESFKSEYRLADKSTEEIEIESNYPIDKIKQFFKPSHGWSILSKR